MIMACYPFRVMHVAQPGFSGLEIGFEFHFGIKRDVSGIMDCINRISDNQMGVDQMRIHQNHCIQLNN